MNAQFNRGIHRRGGSLAAVFMGLVPVTTILLAFTVLGERPGAVQVFGTLTVMAGVFLAGTVPRAGAHG